jgi:hypothetical protein
MINYKNDNIDKKCRKGIVLINPLVKYWRTSLVHYFDEIISIRGRPAVEIRPFSLNF